MHIRRGAWCISHTGSIVFITQINYSNVKGSFYALPSERAMNWVSYYEDALPLPQALVCPGNGAFESNKLKTIKDVTCEFRTNGGKSVTAMTVTKKPGVSMRNLDGTYQDNVQCYSIDGKESRVVSAFDVAQCDVSFWYHADNGFFGEINDLMDDQSRVYFTNNEYEIEKNNEKDQDIIFDPKDMPLYWQRVDPLHLTVLDIDLVEVESRHKKYNHGEYGWFQGKTVEKIPFQFVNLTADPGYYESRPVLSFTYGYGFFFTQELKEYKYYPVSVAMGVIFGYCYMLSLIGLLLMFVSSWIFGYGWPIWSWSERSGGDPPLSSSGTPPQYYSSSFGQNIKSPIASGYDTGVAPPAAPNTGYGSIA